MATSRWDELQPGVLQDLADKSERDRQARDQLQQSIDAQRGDGLAKAQVDFDRAKAELSPESVLYPAQLAKAEAQFEEDKAAVEKKHADDTKALDDRFDRVRSADGAKLESLQVRSEREPPRDDPNAASAVNPNADFTAALPPPPPPPPPPEDPTPDKSK